ncbi:MAG TPA: prepilin-type N-terminal cleavage/methylation domain-containing protein [Acidimicrobiia bacterium]|jgi:prepilin-type N-terminal cleavage/methylation domain-containing protein
MNDRSITTSVAHEAGFTLMELLVSVGIAAMLAAVATLAVHGFADAGTSARCRDDTLRLRKAESTYFVAHDNYGDEADLVADALLDAPSDLHDVVLTGPAYTISEVGSCIGQGSAYGIPAPTVGTTDHSGATVAVVAPDGSGVAGVGASAQRSGDPSWTTMGTTDASGRVSAPLVDGTYNVRVVFDGATNVLSQVAVSNGTLVTFPAVPLTVRLRDAVGHGVAGGAISVAVDGGPPVALGSTPASGDLVIRVLPSAYDVSLTYGSSLSTHPGVMVAGPTVTTFQLCTTVVRLLAVDGTGVGFGGVSATPSAGGSSIVLGTTDASGTVTATLLDGTYDVTITFSGQTSTQTVSITGSATITFRFVTVTVHLAQSSGAALSGGDAAAWYRAAGSNSWSALGTPNSSGNATVDVLPSTYDFEARWFGISEAQSAVPIATATTVTFHTVGVPLRMRTSTGAPLSGQDSLVYMRITGQPSWTAVGVPDAAGDVTAELFPGIYDFEARWYGVMSVQTAIVVAPSTTVTFTTTAATSRLLASTGGGLSGQDSAFFFRVAGTSPWNLTGSPDPWGTGVQELFPANYDFEARWFGAVSVQSAIAVAPGAPPTVVFRTTHATMHLIASTGIGLTGQDGAFMVRVVGTGPWTVFGIPDGAGALDQELFPGPYDFDARWFGADSPHPAVTVVAGVPLSLTFQTTLATLRMLSSSGSPLTGADGAFFVRQTGTTMWIMSGAPDTSGTVAQELFAAPYDVEARWFGATVVQSAVDVHAPTTVTFQSKLATLRMLSSTGTGLAGQDESMWVRQSGTSAWYQSATPIAGVVTQELFAGTYDVRSRWFGVFAQQSSVAVNSAVTVTFTATPLTLRMLTSTGAGLTGQDEAIWVRATGTTAYFFLGAPPATGVAVQELFPSTYDAKFRWTGSTITLGSNVVSAPTMVTLSAAAVIVTCRRQSDGTAVSGATGMVVNGGVTYPFGTSNASGVVNVQELVGAHDFRCKLGALVGTNTNVNIPAGGASTTVNMS